VTLTTTHLAVGCQCLPLKTWAKTWKDVAKEHGFSASEVRIVRAAVCVGVKALNLQWMPPKKQAKKKKETA